MESQDSKNVSILGAKDDRISRKERGLGYVHIAVVFAQDVMHLARPRPIYLLT
jgi:hypothetical protein